MQLQEMKMFTFGNAIIYIYFFFFLPKKIDLEGQTEIYFINKLLVPNCG